MELSTLEDRGNDVVDASNDKSNDNEQLIGQPLSDGGDGVLSKQRRPVQRALLALGILAVLTLVVCVGLWASSDAAPAPVAPGAGTKGDRPTQLRCSK